MATEDVVLLSGFRLNVYPEDLTLWWFQAVAS